MKIRGGFILMLLLKSCLASLSSQHQGNWKTVWFTQRVVWRPSRWDSGTGYATFILFVVHIHLVSPLVWWVTAEWHSSRMWGVKYWFGLCLMSVIQTSQWWVMFSIWLYAQTLFHLSVCESEVEAVNSVMVLGSPLQQGIRRTFSKWTC